MSANLRDDKDKKSRLVASAVARLQALKRVECFDPLDSESRPTPAQQQVINDFGQVRHQYIRAGSQSGKSQTCSRLITWALQDKHPTWSRPPGGEPLLVLIAGRTGKQIEDSLLPRLLGYLDPTSYKLVRIGNIIQRIEFENGDRVVFQSLENPHMARERLQSYTAHIAWVDELPPTLEILAELHRSIQAKNGQFLASFTPLTPSYEIQQYIDGVEARKDGFACIYRFRMLDNPVYASDTRKSELLKQLEFLPEKQRNARLYGDWLLGDENVYSINPEIVFRDLPPHYSTSQWRHIVSVDPAMSSDTGLTVWAEDPQTPQGVWYCVLAEYIQPTHDPVKLVYQIKKLTDKYNVIRRITDPHGGGNWFAPIAWRETQQSYTSMQNKAGRKDELIAKFQMHLGTRMLLVSKYCSDLIRELQNCRYSEVGEGKIVNASSYHLADSSQYVSDNLPSPNTPAAKGLMGDGIQADNWWDWLNKANEKRKTETKKVVEAKQKQAETRNNKLRIRRNYGRFTR